MQSAPVGNFRSFRDHSLVDMFVFCLLVLDVVDNYIRVKTFFDIAVQCDTKEINVVE